MTGSVIFSDGFPVELVSQYFADCDGCDFSFSIPKSKSRKKSATLFTLIEKSGSALVISSKPDFSGFVVTIDGDELPPIRTLKASRPSADLGFDADTTVHVYCIWYPGGVEVGIVGVGNLNFNYDAEDFEPFKLVWGSTDFHGTIEDPVVWQERPDSVGPDSLGSVNNEDGGKKFVSFNPANSKPIFAPELYMGRITGVWEGQALAANNRYEPSLVSLPTSLFSQMRYGKDLLENHVIYESQRYLLFTNAGTAESIWHLITDSGLDLSLAALSETSNGFEATFTGHRISDDIGGANPPAAENCVLRYRSIVVPGKPEAKYSLTLDFTTPDHPYSQAYVRQRQIDRPRGGPAHPDKQSWVNVFTEKPANIKLFLRGYDITKVDMINIHKIHDSAFGKRAHLFAWINEESSDYLMATNYPCPYGIFGNSRQSSEETTINYLISDAESLEQRAAHNTSVEHSYGGNLGISAGKKGGASIGFGYSTANSYTLRDHHRSRVEHQSFTSSSFTSRYFRDNFVDRSLAFLDGQPGARDGSDKTDGLKFYDDLMGLLSASENDDLDRFIAKYGTHYLVSASFGMHAYMHKVGTRKTTEYLLETGNTISASKNFSVNFKARIPVKAVRLKPSFNYGQTNSSEDDTLKSTDIEHTFDSDLTEAGTVGSTDEHGGGEYGLFPVRRHFRPLSNLLAPPFFNHTLDEFYPIMTTIRNKLEQRISAHMLGPGYKVDEGSAHFLLVRILSGFDSTAVKRIFNPDPGGEWKIGSEVIDLPKVCTFEGHLENIELVCGSMLRKVGDISFKASYDGLDFKDIENSGTFETEISMPERTEFYFVGGDEADLRVRIGKVTLSASTNKTPEFKRLQKVMHNLGQKVPQSADINTALTNVGNIKWSGTAFNNEDRSWQTQKTVDIGDIWKKAVRGSINLTGSQLILVEGLKFDISVLVE